jgi:asparagine synthase (glutamine-hydrolysing)
VSALAGCCWFEAPASAADLQPSLACAAHRARAPFHIWSSGPIALASAPLSPHYDSLSRTTVVVDGFIDNLDEVADALGLPAKRGPCDVVRAAHARWGLDAGSRLIGDFVVIICDELNRRVTVIRDPMGQRPLFYGRCARGIVFASELQQIVRHPAIQTAVNEPMLAELLTDSPATIAETLWRDVYRLPPAHALEITGESVSVRRYWNWNPEADVRASSSAARDEQFRDVLTRAVECRVRDTPSVGVLLSGGIDSSAVAGIAESLRRKSGRSSVHAFTLAFPGRPCDETPFSRAVIEKWALQATTHEPARPARSDFTDSVTRDLDVPPYPNSLAADALRRSAAANGVGLLLTGAGGDDFFAGTGGRLTALLRRGHLLSWSRAIVGPLLPGRAREALRPLLGARPPRRPWIRADFARRIGLEDRLRPAPSLSFPTRAQQEMHAVAASLGQILGDEMEDRAAHAAGIVQRHPFCDRRVADLGLALPESERSTPGHTKILVKRALRDYLPETVAAREDKAEFSSTYVDALAALGGETMFAPRRPGRRAGSMRSEEAGWVDGHAVRDMHARMLDLYRRGDEAYIAYAGPLWAVAAVELWLEFAHP